MQNLEETVHLQLDTMSDIQPKDEDEFLHEKKFRKKDARTEEAIVELAINETGFGKFSIKVTIICFLIYSNISLSTTNTGFMLTAAACDLKMNTVDKGWLSTSFFIGSCCSTVVSGFVANFKGRKWTLMVFLFIQGSSDLLQAIVSNYSAIMGLKFISGFAGTGQLITVFTYLCECLPLKQRKILLSLMEFFWICGHGFASALGYGIIPLGFEIQTQSFSFRSWNLYMLICSLPGISLGFWLISFPESPKYLAEMGSKEKLLKVLIYMYEQNFRKPGKEYIDKLMNSGNAFLMKVANHSQDNLADLNRKSLSSEKFLQEFKQMWSILKPPYMRNTLFACITSFCVPSAYYALYLWLPEIFQRFAEFEARNTNEKTNFCSVARQIRSSLTNQLEDPFDCNKPVDNKVFINNLILCASCIPAILPVLLLVNRFGFKILLASGCLLCSATVFGIYFVNSSLQNLILLCIYLPLISVCLTIIFALFVSIFPTNLRSSGVTLTSFSSRLGAVFGNIVFSYLIEQYCLQFIILVALVLIFSAITTMLIQEK